MFTITRPSNIQLFKFWLLNFSSIQTNFLKNFIKIFPGFKIDFESTDKVLLLCHYLWSEISQQWNNNPFKIFFSWNLHGRAFCFLILSNERNIKTSILLMLLKCIVVSYLNRNGRFTGRLFSNYGLLNMLFHFFRYLIYSVFHDTFVKRFIKKLSFLSSNFKNQFQDVVYYRKLGCLTLWYWNGGPLNIR